MRYVYILGPALLLMGACKKINIAAPIDQLTTVEVFADSTSAEAAVLGIYSQINNINFSTQHFLYGNVTLFPALSADELHYNAVDQVYTPFEQDAVQTDNSNNESNYQNAYSIIYQCNQVIEQLGLTSSLALTQVTRLTGEAKFLRALHYFYLTNEYGAVAMPLTPDYTKNVTLSRTDSADVYKQIITDLQDAEAQTGTLYTTTGKVRANRYAAAALLARVYLYQKDYMDAITEASMVLSSGFYTLADPTQTFIPDNSEAILQIMPPPTNQTLISTPEGELFVPYPASYGIIPTYSLTPQLVSSFEPGDLRRKDWTTDDTINGVNYTSPYKYKIQYAFTSEEYEIALRLADVILVRAEAEAFSSQLGPAINDLDMVRGRAGLPLIGTTDPGISQEALVDTLYHERRIEFFTEWGHRWFDLKRTGLVNTVMTAMKGTQWTPTAVLYPIPQSELLAAPNLSQNPGYN